MAQIDLLKRVAEVLEAADVPYMITGSFASSFLGVPRSTHDIDLVVDLPFSAGAVLLREFPPPEFYLSERAIKEALGQGGMFNLIQTTTADKVDFWMLKDEPFELLCFHRRFRAEFHGHAYWFPKPEELILLKLRWFKLSGSSGQQFKDAVGVYRVQREVIDQAHLDHWAMRIGVSDLLSQLRTDAEQV